MEQVRMMRCGLCNVQADMREMRYHKSGEYLICGSCHDKQALGMRAAEKPAPVASSVKPVSELASKKAQKTAYRCNNCGYSFSRNKEHRFELCPYCGKKSLSVAERGGAQNLLDEAQY